MSSKLIWAITVLALIGFTDALYLSVGHYSGAHLVCGIGGCNEVLRSEYATFLGVPVALLGTGYYLIVFLLAVWCLDVRRPKILSLIASISTLGLAAAFYFVGLQIFMIGTFCLYCLISAAASVGIFILARLAVRADSRLGV